MIAHCIKHDFDMTPLKTSFASLAKKLPDTLTLTISYLSPAEWAIDGKDIKLTRSSVPGSISAATAKEIGATMQQKKDKSASQFAGVDGSSSSSRASLKDRSGAPKHLLL